jgi:thymidylate synthase (FAD)
MDKLFQVKTIASTPNPQKVIYAAMNQDYSAKYVSELTENITEAECGKIVIKRLLEGGKGHFGPLEHPQITLACGYFPHSVMQQARTHRVGISFDCQCLSADTVVTFVNINGQSSHKLKKTMGELYDLWTNGEKAIRSRLVAGKEEKYRRDSKKRISNMRVRSLDEENNTFTSNHIQDVVFNGLNPVYKVTLADNKSIKCTQNHRILTPFGWRTLSQLSVGSEVLVNGHPLANAGTTYQNKEWLQEQFEKGLIPKEAAALAGCSAEAIKKWAYHHNLTWQQRQWNRGIKYHINISEAERDRRREHGRTLSPKLKGEDHPSWKPDLPEGKRAYNWLKYNRDRIILEKGSTCSNCGNTQNLHVHHILTVKDRPDLIYDESNMSLLCSSCHSRHHHLGSSNPLCAHPIEIASIEYVGVEPTYDLVMKTPHHNFVADGIVVHNSMRYTSQNILDVSDPVTRKDGEGAVEALEKAFYLRPVGAYTDRSGGKYEYTNGLRNEDLVLCSKLAGGYYNNIKNGMSEEHARGMLPFDYRQHFVVSFNARSLMHFLTIRGKKDAQLEIQQLCELMLPCFAEWMPQVSEWFMTNLWLKGRLAP